MAERKRVLKTTTGSATKGQVEFTERKIDVIEMMAKKKLTHLAVPKHEKWERFWGSSSLCSRCEVLPSHPLQSSITATSLSATSLLISFAISRIPFPSSSTLAATTNLLYSLYHSLYHSPVSLTHSFISSPPRSIVLLSRSLSYHSTTSLATPFATSPLCTILSYSRPCHSGQRERER
jgi:hypothetical protein